MIRMRSCGHVCVCVGLVCEKKYVHGESAGCKCNHRAYSSPRALASE